MKKFFLMVPVFLTFLSAAAQNQKLNFEAPLQILDNHSGNVSPRYASDVSFTMMPTFIKNGKGLVGLLETCHGVTWDDHLFTGLGAGASYSFFTEEVFIPVFAEGRYTLSGSGRFMPFFSLRLGGLFCTERKSNNFYENFVDFVFFVARINTNQPKNGLSQRKRNYEESNSIDSPCGVYY